MAGVECTSLETLFKLVVRHVAQYKSVLAVSTLHSPLEFGLTALPVPDVWIDALVEETARNYPPRNCSVQVELQADAKAARTLMQLLEATACRQTCLSTRAPALAEYLRSTRHVEEMIQGHFGGSEAMACVRGIGTSALGALMGTRQNIMRCIQYAKPKLVSPTLHVAPRERKQLQFERVATLLHLMRLEMAATQVLDVGGGKGSLAEALSDTFGVPCVTVDANGGLQQHGEALYRHCRKGRASDRTSWTERLVDDTVESKLMVWLEAKPSVVGGLHTCGRLADYTLSLSKRIPSVAGVVCVPCCYNHLVPRSWLFGSSPLTSWHYAPRSVTGASLGLQDLLSSHPAAFALANLSHSMTYEQFALWYQYRRAVFTLCMLHRQRPAAFCVADGKKPFEHADGGLRIPRDFNKLSTQCGRPHSFANFCRQWEQCASRDAAARVVISMRDEELERYYCASEVSLQAQRHLIARALQDRMGAVVEALLVLDRCFGLVDGDGCAMDCAFPCQVFDAAWTARKWGVVGLRRGSQKLLTA